MSSQAQLESELLTSLPLTDLESIFDLSAEDKIAQLLLHRELATQRLKQHGQCYPPYLLHRAWIYRALQYHDLAAFDAYTVYTLCLKTLSDEFVTDLDAHNLDDGQIWLSELDETARLDQARKTLCQACAVLVDALTALGPLRDASKFQAQLQETTSVLAATTKDFDPPKWVTVLDPKSAANAQPTRFGTARREIYPWSKYEPDRNTVESGTELNTYLGTISSDLEARVTALPAFDADGQATDAISYQLGLFAKHDLKPDQEVLSEKSILTAIRPLEDAICDACGQELEGIPYEDIRQCDGEDCDTPFCSEECKQRAVTGYHRPNLDEEEDDEEDEEEEEEEGEEGHDDEDGTLSNDDNDTASEPGGDDATANNTSPAPFCGNTDLSTIGRPTTTDTPEWDLYFLLLTRSIAMSLTQSKHPLSFLQTKFIWGDFQESSVTAPRTLPFSLTHSLEYVLDYFTTLSLSDARATPYSAYWLENYDFWILQTLYAKFRGVANASQSTFDGKAEIASVHLGWCLANHSCEPNVRWAPKGVRRFFVKPTERGGIKKDEEVFSHYTDIRLPVNERRERLREVLGGDCQCTRCQREIQ